MTLMLFLKTFLRFISPTTKNGIFVDLHELLFDKDCLSLLLTAEETVDSEAVKSKAVEQTPTVYSPKNKVGQKPLWQKFPQLIETATEFIKSHSFQAHVRRQETTNIGNGITLREIRNHLLENVTGLAAHGISVDAIHHLTVGPRKNSS